MDYPSVWHVNSATNRFETTLVDFFNPSVELRLTVIFRNVPIGLAAISYFVLRCFIVLSFTNIFLFSRIRFKADRSTLNIADISSCVVEILQDLKNSSQNPNVYNRSQITRVVRISNFKLAKPVT
jgi:hypothetical protein